MSSAFQDIITSEINRLDTLLKEQQQILDDQETDRRQLNDELTAMKQAKLDAFDWKEKEAIEDEIGNIRGRMSARTVQDTRALRKPYFGVLSLDDDDLGELTYCLGSATLFGKSGAVRVIDWRDAPVSRLYYEYDVGEEFDEEIRGRERSGRISIKRQVEITDGDLLTISEKGLVFARDPDGDWRKVDPDQAGVSRRKEAAKDHRLPEITALIGKAQFQAITRSPAGTFVLQGGAGSGKTTVGLHRIAWLLYQNPQQFQPGRILVVMFNKALQAYISKVLPDLGIGSGVRVRTFHQWAGDCFRNAGLRPVYSKRSAAPDILAVKRQPGMTAAMDGYLDRIVEKSKTWLADQLEAAGDPEMPRIRSALESILLPSDLMRNLTGNDLFMGRGIPGPRREITRRLLGRLTNHVQDLHSLLTDPEQMASVCADPGLLNRFIAHHRQLKEKGEIDFSDTGLLLYLLQQKGHTGALPAFAHIMIDEAQDFSPTELTVMLQATDEDRSVTVCGDMAQQIYGLKSSENQVPWSFESILNRGLKQSEGATRASTTLAIGYRATRPVMELAWKVLGKEPVMEVPRDGAPVEILSTNSPVETADTVCRIAADYLEKHPRAILGIILKQKQSADDLFAAIKTRVPGVRRHERNDFTFKPGALVTNIHQVKGLEFTAVILVNPSVQDYRDTPSDRMLLHVGITRASDRLWLVGHDPMAYNLEPAEKTP